MLNPNIMKKYLSWSLSLLIVIGIISCTGSKRLSKKADKLQKAGLTEEAADFYYLSLLRNPKNVDAKIGLKATGSEMINSKLNDFYKAHSIDNSKEAVYRYRDAIELKDKFDPFVKIDIPPYYEEYYQESLTKYLKVRYTEATELVYEEKYEQADVIFKEILVLKPNYEDAQQMATLTTVEPLYQKGVASYDAGKFRSSYNYFDQVLEVDPAYKDAIDLKNMAQDEAMITVAVIPFEDVTSRSSTIGEKVYIATVQALTRSDNPFIKVVDRSNTDKLVSEQRLSLENGGDLIAGELEGAEVIVTGKITSFSKTGGNVQAQKMPGYQAQRIKKVNPDTKKTYTDVIYKKTYYTEYTGSVEIVYTCQVQMIQTETGEVLSTELMNVKKSDAVNFAKYKGDYKDLYSGSFKNAYTPLAVGDKVNTSYREKQTLNQKFTTSKTQLKSTAELQVEASQELSKRIASLVERYNPEI